MLLCLTTQACHFLVPFLCSWCIHQEAVSSPRALFHICPPHPAQSQAQSRLLDEGASISYCQLTCPCFHLRLLQSLLVTSVMNPTFTNPEPGTQPFSGSFQHMAFVQLPLQKQNHWLWQSVTHLSVSVCKATVRTYWFVISCCVALNNFFFFNFSVP